VSRDVVFAGAGRVILPFTFMRSAGLGVALLCASICSAPPAAGAFELERGGAGGATGKVFGDRAASGKRAVSLSGRRALVRRFSTSRPIVRITLRARGGRCGGAPRMRVVLDGRRVVLRAVRSRRWSRLRLAARRRAGRHTLRVALTNPRRGRRCRRRLMLDYAAIALEPRREASRTPARVPTPPAAAVPPPNPPPPTAYRNPVFAAPGAPDPMVLDAGGGHDDYYAFSTGDLFPVLRSADLVNWTVAQPALAERPGWAVQSGEYNPWGPSVIERPGACPGGSGPRCFLLFHVSRHGTLSPPTNCIGVAVSHTPGGPYTELGPLANDDAALDASGRPPGCGDDAGYSNIDPAPFVASDGTPYLYLSTTRTCSGQAPGEVCPPGRRISVIELAPDLLTAAGPRQALFGGEASGWELAQFSTPAPVVENPAPVKRGSTYFLLYSGGAFNGAYGMGYATSASPTGPFVKAAENPVLAERNGVLSVGGGALVTGPRGGSWLVYHGREGSYANPRQLRIDPVRFPGDTTVVIDGPTSTPQAVAP
jgi:hypothetical protein